MKRSFTIFLASTGFLLFAALSVFLFYTGMATKRTADGFLTHVVKREFEQASAFVFFYDESPAQKPNISQNKAAQLWIDRIRLAEQDGLEVQNYKNLRLWEEDGHPVGEVDLVISLDGRKQTVEKVKIHFIQHEGKWKIDRLAPPPGETKKTWAPLLTGKINKPA